MRHSLLIGACAVCFAGIASAATPVATYEFQNTLNSDQGGAVPALTAIDPEGTSGFVTDTVMGNPQTVYAFNGDDTTPLHQAGLTLNTTGLLTDPGSYSVDMILEFTQRDGAWRRLLDVQNRQSDDGFYVDPSNDLDIFPISGSTAAWTNNVFHHVVLTVDDSTTPNATVSAYLDGVSQFSTTTNEMNLNFDPTDNPNQLLGFFLDNVAGGGQGEWSPGEIAFARLWNGALTPAEAEALLPEPSTLAIFAAAGLLLQRRRNRA
jgi:Concanavalin A-like lectin/glucanases superfamily